MRDERGSALLTAVSLSFVPDLDPESAHGAVGSLLGCSATGRCCSCSGDWGASYLFIKVALEDIEPAPMMAFRGLVAGVILFVYLVATIGGGAPTRSSARAGGPCSCWVRSMRPFPFGSSRGGDSHRLQRRRDCAVDGADLHVSAGGAIPARRGRGPGPPGWRRARLPGGRRPRGVRPARRLVGGRWDVRRRPRVIVVRVRRNLRAAPCQDGVRRCSPPARCLPAD